jgi:hypothetical protein
MLIFLMMLVGAPALLVGNLALVGMAEGCEDPEDSEVAAVAEPVEDTNEADIEPFWEELAIIGEACDIDVV